MQLKILPARLCGGKACFMGSLVKVYCIPLKMKATAAGEAINVGTEENIDGVANFNIGLNKGALVWV